MTCLVEKILWRSCSNPPCEALQEDLEDALHDPAQVLHRRSCGDPGGILSNRSLPEDLADAMFYRCLYESSCGRLLGGSWEALVARSCKLRSSSSRCFYDDLVSLVFLGCSKELLV